MTITNNNTETWVSKVQALIAKAESTEFPDEAEAFMAKAQELMTRHAIDLAMLDGESGRREPGKVGRTATHPCGTNAAYKRHQRHGEAPCAACRAAWAEYQREMYHRRKGRA